MQKKFYPAEWINTLKQKNDIVSVISGYTPVEKRGKSFWARCPFHHEKTPSFSINAEEGFYHCFGCNTSGDVISFVAAMENISQGEAIKLLAEKAQMEIPHEMDREGQAQRKAERDQMISALNAVRDFYVKTLYEKTSVKAQQYIKQRGLTKKDLDAFQIGYSANKTSLVKYLQDEMKLSKELLFKAGIIAKEPEYEPYDFQFGRLIFPILNSYGDCIGFSGRLLENIEGRAKYKNTSATMVFDKSKVLFAIHLVKEFKRNNPLKNIILCEGQMDVIAFHHNGFGNAVATLGTALTEKHGLELKRYCDEVILCFDGDSAGQKATQKAIDILVPLGLHVKIISLPENLDPDDFLKKYGKGELKKQIDKAIEVIDYRLKLSANTCDFTKSADKARYVKEAISILSEMDNFSEMDAYLNQISTQTGIHLDLLRKDMQRNVSAVNIIESDTSAQKVLDTAENGKTMAIKFIVTYAKKYRTLPFFEQFLPYILNPAVQERLNRLLCPAEENADDIENECAEYEIQLNLECAEEKRYLEDCMREIMINFLNDQQDFFSQKWKDAQTSEERNSIIQLQNTVNRKMIKIKQKKTLEEILND